MGGDGSNARSREKCQADERIVRVGRNWNGIGNHWKAVGKKLERIGEVDVTGRVGSNARKRGDARLMGQMLYAIWFSF